MRTIITFMLLAACGLAQAQQTEYELKRDTPPTGSRMRIAGAKSSIPFDQPWEKLSREQQAEIMAPYESMGPGDEPPYPLNGTRKIWNAFVKASDHMHVHGHVRIIVEVNAEGKATSAQVYATPDERITKYVASVMMNERYKPARCKGQPCAQQFMFDADWSL